MKPVLIFLALAAVFAVTALAQVSINTGDYGVQVQGGAVAVNTGEPQTGIIGSDVQVDGITIINGILYIDGEKVPRGTRTYTSKKSKKTYRIQWGTDGNISVSEK